MSEMEKGVELVHKVPNAFSRRFQRKHVEPHVSVVRMEVCDPSRHANCNFPPSAMGKASSVIERSVATIAS